MGCNQDCNGAWSNQLGKDLTALGIGTAMANSSQDYSGSSADEANSCVVENFMWDEWTRPSTVADEVSTATFLPDLITSFTSSTGLSFHQTDMLSSWMSTFHPLALHSSLTTTELDPHPELFMHEAGLPTALEAHPQATSQPTLQTYFGEEALPLPPSGMLSGPKTTHTSRYLQALGPLSPSSPLAIHNGVLNPLGDPWDGGSVSSASVPSWAESFSPQSTTHSRIYIPDQQTASAIDHVEDGSDCTRVASRPRHTDIFIGPNGTIEATPGGWTPHFYDGTSQTTTTTSVMKPMKMMATLREAGESSTSRALPSAHAVNISQNQTKLATFVADYNKRDVDQSLWLGKHRLQLAVDDDSNRGSLQLKRSKLSVARGAGSALQWGEADQGLPGEILRTYNCPSGSLASQAMDIIAIGPALNTNGKPRARRGSATDPQSVYARQRRERINDRLKKLQQLVPNGAKVDIVTMLDEAYDYVKFLQYQLSLLHSDELWVLANPYNYNGMDISNLASEQTQELESSAT